VIAKRSAILSLGIEFRGGQRIDNPEALLRAAAKATPPDAVLSARRAAGRISRHLPQAQEAPAKNIHIGSTGCRGVSFGHIDRISSNAIVLGGGNTAVDYRRIRSASAARREIIVRSATAAENAPWEKEGAMRGADVCFRAQGVHPHKSASDQGYSGEIGSRKVIKRNRQLGPTGGRHFACDDVLIAVGQENAFPWIERDAGVEFDEHGLRG
jgi:hypothetical protein